MSHQTKLWIALIALYIVWGSTYLGIRIAVETIPPFLHASIRFLISGLILVTWRRMAGDAMPTARQWRSTGIVGLFLLVGGNGLVSFAERTVPSGIAALIVGTSPLWLTIFESMRPGGVKPGWLTIVGLFVGFGGIALLVGPAEFSRDAGTALDLTGSLILLCAPFLWSLGSIYAKTADMPSSSLMSTGAQMLIGSLGLVIVSLLTGELHGFTLAQVSMRSLIGLLYLISFGSLIGFVAYGWLLHNAPISLVSTYAYVNPIVAVLLGALFVNEAITPRVIVAAAIIIGSVFLINWAKQVAKSKEVQASQ
jgi:drug/metabolite transporter (DMT)-like permease